MTSRRETRREVRAGNHIDTDNNDNDTTPAQEQHESSPLPFKHFNIFDTTVVEGKRKRKVTSRFSDDFSHQKHYSSPGFRRDAPRRDHREKDEERQPNYADDSKSDCDDSSSPLSSDVPQKNEEKSKSKRKKQSDSDSAVSTASPEVRTRLNSQQVVNGLSSYVVKRWQLRLRNVHHKLIKSIAEQRCAAANSAHWSSSEKCSLKETSPVRDKCIENAAFRVQLPVSPPANNALSRRIQVATLASTLQPMHHFNASAGDLATASPSLVPPLLRQSAADYVSKKFDKLKNSRTIAVPVGAAFVAPGSDVYNNKYLTFHVLCAICGSMSSSASTEAHDDHRLTPPEKTAGRPQSDWLCRRWYAACGESDSGLDRDDGIQGRFICLACADFSSRLQSDACASARLCRAYSRCWRRSTTSNEPGSPSSVCHIDPFNGSNYNKENGARMREAKCRFCWMYLAYRALSHLWPYQMRSAVAKLLGVTSVWGEIEGGRNAVESAQSISPNEQTRTPHHGTSYTSRLFLLKIRDETSRGSQPVHAHAKFDSFDRIVTECVQLRQRIRQLSAEAASIMPFTADVPPNSGIWLKDQRDSEHVSLVSPAGGVLVEAGDLVGFVKSTGHVFDPNVANFHCIGEQRRMSHRVSQVPLKLRRCYAGFSDDEEADSPTAPSKCGQRPRFSSGQAKSSTQDGHHKSTQGLPSVEKDSTPTPDIEQPPVATSQVASKSRPGANMVSWFRISAADTAVAKSSTVNQNAEGEEAQLVTALNTVEEYEASLRLIAATSVGRQLLADALLYNLPDGSDDYDGNGERKGDITIDDIFFYPDLSEALVVNNTPLGIEDADINRIVATEVSIGRHATVICSEKKRHNVTSSLTLRRIPHVRLPTRRLSEEMASSGKLSGNYSLPVALGLRPLLQYTAEKPPLNYRQLLIVSMFAMRDRGGAQRHIFQAVQTLFPYFVNANIGWRSALRYNLCVYPEFVRQKEDGWGAAYYLFDGIETTNVFQSVAKIIESALLDGDDDDGGSDIGLRNDGCGTEEDDSLTAANGSDAEMDDETEVIDDLFSAENENGAGMGAFITARWRSVAALHRTASDLLAAYLSCDANSTKTTTAAAAVKSVATTSGYIVAETVKDDLSHAADNARDNVFGAGSDAANDLCFACASPSLCVGTANEFIRCRMCCQPYHVFCVPLVDLPQSRYEERFEWLCVRCRPCAICGFAYTPHGCVSDTFGVDSLVDRFSELKLTCCVCSCTYHAVCLRGEWTGSSGSLGSSADGASLRTQVLSCVDRLLELWFCPGCMLCESCGVKGATWLADCTDAAPPCNETNDAGKHVATTAKRQTIPINGDKESGQEGEERQGMPLMSGEALCANCAAARSEGTCCPLCRQAYDNNDYDSRMVECVRCKRWVHVQCETLYTEDQYQMLSHLPDDVSYICRLCCHEAQRRIGPDFWLRAVRRGVAEGCRVVAEAAESIHDASTRKYNSLTSCLNGVIDAVANDDDQGLIGINDSALADKIAALCATAGRRAFPDWFDAYAERELMDVMFDCRPRIDHLYAAADPADRLTAMSDVDRRPPTWKVHQANCASSDDASDKHIKNDGNQNDTRYCLLCKSPSSVYTGRLLPYSGRVGADAAAVSNGTAAVQWIHVNCCFFSAEVFENVHSNEKDANTNTIATHLSSTADKVHGRDRPIFLADVPVAVSRSFKSFCSVCSRRGATVRCCLPKCNARFHLPCAVASDVVVASLDKCYTTYCSATHRLKHLLVVSKRGSQSDESRHANDHKVILLRELSIDRLNVNRPIHLTSSTVSPNVSTGNSDASPSPSGFHQLPRSTVLSLGAISIANLGRLTVPADRTPTSVKSATPHSIASAVTVDSWCHGGGASLLSRYLIGFCCRRRYWSISDPMVVTTYICRSRVVKRRRPHIATIVSNDKPHKSLDADWRLRDLHLTVAGRRHRRYRHEVAAFQSAVGQLHAIMHDWRRVDASIYIGRDARLVPPGYYCDPVDADNSASFTALDDDVRYSQSVYDENDHDEDISMMQVDGAADLDDDDRNSDSSDDIDVEGCGHIVTTIAFRNSGPAPSSGHSLASLPSALPTVAAASSSNCSGRRNDGGAGRNNRTHNFSIDGLLSPPPTQHLQRPPQVQPLSMPPAHSLYNLPQLSSSSLAAPSLEPGFRPPHLPMPPLASAPLTLPSHPVPRHLTVRTCVPLPLLQPPRQPSQQTPVSMPRLPFVQGMPSRPARGAATVPPPGLDTMTAAFMASMMALPQLPPAFLAGPQSQQLDASWPGSQIVMQQATLINQLLYARSAMLLAPNVTGNQQQTQSVVAAPVPSYPASRPPPFCAVEQLQQQRQQAPPPPPPSQLALQRQLSPVRPPVMPVSSATSSNLRDGRKVAMVQPQKLNTSTSGENDSGGSCGLDQSQQQQQSSRKAENEVEEGSGSDSRRYNVVGGGGQKRSADRHLSPPVERSEQVKRLCSASSTSPTAATIAAESSTLDVASVSVKATFELGESGMSDNSRNTASPRLMSLASVAVTCDIGDDEAGAAQQHDYILSMRKRLKTRRKLVEQVTLESADEQPEWLWPTSLADGVQAEVDVESKQHEISGDGSERLRRQQAPSGRQGPLTVEPTLCHEDDDDDCDYVVVYDLYAEDGSFARQGANLTQLWAELHRLVEAAKRQLTVTASRGGKLRRERRSSGSNGNSSGKRSVLHLNNSDNDNDNNYSSESGASVAKCLTISGLDMVGLTHEAITYLVEQMPGADAVAARSHYTFRHVKQHATTSLAPTTHSSASQADVDDLTSRQRVYCGRSPFDMFSWLASTHRQPDAGLSNCLAQWHHRQLLRQDGDYSGGFLDHEFGEERYGLSAHRRAMSNTLDLPLTMRFRLLPASVASTVGVYRSRIAGRGLFARRLIRIGEMVIEYAGEAIRPVLTDLRERYYDTRQIGCYMFKVDRDVVIDATLKGNAARFINHSCEPNCYSRIIDIYGTKHIVIFAVRDILPGTELTYDYKFPVEEGDDVKLACSCGSRKCRKYMN